MKADFSGYATKAGLKCTDGRTIMPNAFKDQHLTQVPLVWQHGHNDPDNVLGHVLLENRDGDVYCYAFFNDSPKAESAKRLVAHKDVNALSIWANQLIERSKRVLHGAIREVSLVLAGANPGALIDNVMIQHDDGSEEIIDGEAIIHTGLPFDGLDVDYVDPEENKGDPNLEHKDDKEKPKVEETDKLEHATEDDETIEDVFNSLTEKQKDVVAHMIGEALESANDTNSNDNAEHGETTNKEGKDMSRNVFEKDPAADKHILSHDAVKGIVATALKGGSLREAVEEYALEHGITDIDQLFPEARAISDAPELFKRRTEWVNQFLGQTRKSPFSRIKTLSADLTFEEARAKGYVKGALKKEEFFGVSKRVTTPTTVYKKQKLDRDDVVDITDFDIVSWLKGEMRIMLDEEIARACLVGDGRDVSHEDKINEGNIRPIATDHELFTTVINVNIDDSSSSVQEIIDALILNRRFYRGTGQPTLFTSETYIARFLLLKDSLGRRIYKSLDELANELRVTAIVPVEVLEEYPDLVAVVVNPVDYIIGADKGGNISMFDDFDIDYNQYKYLIETRICGALTKLKSAMVVKKVAGTSVLVTPVSPTFEANVVTVATTTGVTYKNKGTGATLTTGAPVTLTAGQSITVVAVPASATYYFATSEDDEWTFNYEAP